MDDSRIIELYFARDERAVEETKASYGRLIYSVAFRILDSSSDSEECENDTYIRAWNSIPPARPTRLSAYLCKIARNLALNRLRDEKRVLKIELIFDEIGEAIPDNQGEITEMIELRESISGFVNGLGKRQRRIFIKRYFYMQDVKEIAREMGMTRGSVSVALHRVRQELRDYLEERGIVI